MRHITELFDDEAANAACLAALEDKNALTPALELLFRKGFADTIFLPDAEKVFARRLMDVRAEYSGQLRSYLRTPESWLAAQLKTAGTDMYSMDALASGVCWLAAQLHAFGWQKEETADLLRRRMRLAPHTLANNLRLLRLFSSTPLDGLFDEAGSLPGVRVVPGLAELLAAGAYISLKRERPDYVAPDLSFDAVCIWSSALADSLRGAEDSAPRVQDIAVVSGVMACQYMHVTSWPVLSECMRSASALSYPIGLVLTQMAARLPSLRADAGAACQRASISMKASGFSFEDSWMRALREEAGCASGDWPEDGGEAREAEEETLARERERALEKPEGGQK